MEGIKVAVIGLGPAGLTALKTLREEGFNAIAFERREKIGGLWSYSSNTTFTTVLDDTISNASKFVSGFSDFPFPKDSPVYFTGTQASEYFESYARHFNLRQYIRFNISVTKVVRNSSDSAWDVHITNSDGENVLSFDKVVFAHGSEGAPVFPLMSNRDKFKGIVMHAQAYRNSTLFKNRRVLIVGNGNTACELSVMLAKHASKVYQSYRRGRIMFSRCDNNGVPLDSQFTWPVMRLKYFLDSIIPWLTWPFANRFMRDMMISHAARSEPVQPGESRAKILKRTEIRMRKEWRLLPCASMAHVNPAVQEEYIPTLRSGDVTPLHGFVDFAGDNQVLLANNTVVEVDAVLFCTGYDMDFSIMPELEMNGACGVPLEVAGKRNLERTTNCEEHSGINDDGQQPRLPRLFQMLFPPRWASSIAFLSWLAPQENVWCVSELAAIAITQIWAAETAKAKGHREVQSHDSRYRPPALLPPASEMNDQIDAYHTWFRVAWQKERSVLSGYIHHPHKFYRFLHEAAGTGLYDNLDHVFTARGWRLWWKDRDLWKWLAKGPINSYSWRLFDTNPECIPGCGRKVCPEAKKMVKEAYEAWEDYKRQIQRKWV
ncbi:flavin-binding monooxygenase-like-domain-containing protein [Bisporella sp. PMI_857]|nr:flavin-binding monooxygenase-like-domain-containing protein [Bisporella sp. PMI_857]